MPTMKTTSAATAAGSASAPAPDLGAAPAMDSAAGACARAQAPFRLGVVRYLNTLPLIDGLERLAGLELRHEVPARLVELLEAGALDMALCSTIDLARSSVPLQIVPGGCLGCHGETLTVRLFARRAFAKIRTLDADAESHTSVVLAQVLLRELHGVRPTVRAWRDEEGSRDWSKAGDALLLIGDKAVLHAPPASHFPVQMDLGEAWAALTELPFVFAVWMTRADLAPERRARLATIASVLDHQRRHNGERIESIVATHAAQRGWARETAQRYLGELLDFEFTAKHAEGLERFMALAANHGLIDGVPTIAFAPETTLVGAV